MLLQLATKLRHWTTHEGLYLPKKKKCIPGSLSLSLSPPLEERARGEVRGSWTLIGSNHLTAIFGKHVLYPASVQIIISSHGRYTLIWLCFLFWFGFTLMLDVEDLMMLQYMRWAWFWCRCVLIVYMKIYS